MRIASIIHGRLNNISPTSPPCEDFRPKDFAKIQTFPRVGGQLGREWEGMFLLIAQRLLNHVERRGERSLLFIPRIVNRPCKSIRERLLFANFGVWEPSVRTIHTHERATEGMIFRPIRILDSTQTAYRQHTGSTLQLLSVPKTSRLAYLRATCMLSRKSERPLSGIFPLPEYQTSRPIRLRREVVDLISGNQ